jgi:hypothetical protein
MRTLLHRFRKGGTHEHNVSSSTSTEQSVRSSFLLCSSTHIPLHIYTYNTAFVYSTLSLINLNHRILQPQRDELPTSPLCTSSVAIRIAMASMNCPLPLQREKGMRRLTILMSLLFMAWVGTSTEPGLSPKKTNPRITTYSGCLNSYQLICLAPASSLSDIPRNSNLASQSLR